MITDSRIACTKSFRHFVAYSLGVLCVTLSSCAPVQPTTQTPPEAQAPSPEATKNLEAAFNAYTAGDCQESIKRFNEALQQGEHPALFNGLGMAYLLCKQPQSAITIFEKAIRLSPRSAALHANLGTAFYAHNDILQAEEQFQTALNLDPLHAEALVGMASLLIQKGEPEQALKMLFDLKSDAPEIAYNKALALHAMGLADDAEALLRNYIQDTPHDAEAHNALAIILASNGKNLEAQQQMDEAIRLYPIEAAYYYNRGNILKEQSLFKEAEKDYTRAIAFSDRMPEAYLNRGDVRFLLQDFQNACVDLEKACALLPALCERIVQYKALGRCP